VTKRASAIAVLAVAALLAGCVATPPNTEVGDGVTVPSTLVLDSPMSKVSRAMVRFRTVMCDGVYLGSGFAVDAHRIVTNRHVIGGASQVWAETWDGRELHITKTQISPDNDLGVVTVSDDLTSTVRLGHDDPTTGLPVNVVGYPLGHALRVDRGKVEEVLTNDNPDDPNLDLQGSRAIMFKARIRHGNSGGPLVNDSGTAVGVVYRFLSLADTTALAVPIAAVHRVLDGNDLVPNPGCDAFTQQYGGG
jgi:S1-C subfamily serine protease